MGSPAEGESEYWFTWEKVPGEESMKVISALKPKLNLDAATIEKRSDSIIEISSRVDKVSLKYMGGDKVEAEISNRPDLSKELTDKLRAERREGVLTVVWYPKDPTGTCF
jgi:hypothetical protein